ncbi:hypothetical protein BD410DRAFT_734301 [Rickenella mellea]|uniref:CxC2-like cysteine cluster KDZ transposase-associated domain-containing protein n=1 Tax=Rickenella mellea TaxID=50990 RepID=A0A4Y7PH03_9AGAM|nr:hypothetical protein BD410DRAFT_734301 [Rickenella mellea]
MASEAGDSTTGTPCACGSGTRTTRCTDCLQSPLSCEQCFVREHKLLPFHWAEQWNGDFFVRKDYADLGGTITLGHNGDACKHAPSSTAIDLTIVHTNGIHESRVVFCKCSLHGDRLSQLTSHQLFPGSTDSPRQAFTFDLLKNFHLYSLASKKSAYDYMNAIRRLTNNAFSKDAPNPYPAFLRIVRLWRLLTMMKRMGQAHGIDTVLTHRTPGNMAVQCPACPEPGFNMDERIEPLDKSIIRHTETIFLSLDGNFRLQRKKKNNDPDDIALIKGAYFPDGQEYKDYLRKVGDNTPEVPTFHPALHLTSECDFQKSTCAKLNAVNMQEKIKFKGMVCTGVVKCKCARHDFSLPKATANLQKGER